jgi:Holliday junction resolvasome RuvABC endonuclease subunit
MCVASGPGLANASFHYLTDTKKDQGSFFDNLIKGSFHKEWKTPEERYENISEFFIEKLFLLNVPSNTPVFIEDYSFGSKGRVFHIAENTGLMKYKLWKRGHPITVIPPSVIKKFATGKGNAKKEQMYEAWKKDVSLRLTMWEKAKLGSPISDIIDSYYIAQFGFTVTT